MKNLSKALALFVVVAMMLTSVMSVAAFTDVDNGSAYSRAINVDTALGLLNGYPDGTFQPEGSITRAEFAAVVVRMLGQEAQAAGSAAVTPYADVAADHWAAGYINIATQLGIINGYGDGNFGPEDPVLYEQAVKMVVVALGYGPVCDANAYPVSYLTKAGQIGITTGLKGENGANANRGLVAQIVFNSLDKPLMKETGYGLLTSYEVCDGSGDTEKNTVLDEYLDTVKISANVVKSNVLESTTNKTEKVYLKVQKAYKNKYGDESGEDFYQGTSNWFAVGSTNASDFVGKNAIVYINYIDGYKDDSVITYIEEDSAAATESITSDQYESTTTTAAGLFKVEYRENPSDRSTQSFLVSPTAKIYVNGVESAKTLASELGSFYGKAEFSLNDSSIAADYDTVFITDYKTIVVDTVNTKTSRITPKNDESSLTYANSENTIKATLYDANGDIMDWADLEEWDVISYTTTGKTTTTNIVAYLIDNSVTGTVEGQSGDDEFTIGGKDYTANEKIADDIELGDEGVFYLDIMGNIVYYNTDVATSSRNYAYVSKTHIDESFDKALQLKLFTSDGKVDTYDLYSTVKYNGVSKKAEAMATTAIANELKGKLIAYKVNSSNKITSIDTATAWTATSKKSEFTQYGDSVPSSEYRASTEAFDSSKGRVYVTDSTIIFNIEDGSESNFDMISVASLADEDKLLNATFYNVDGNDDQNVGVILTRGVDSNADTAEIAVAVSNGTTQDSDGYEIYSIKAFSDAVTDTYVTDADNELDKIPYNGSVFVPTFKSGNILKKAEMIVETDNKLNVSYVSTHAAGVEFGGSEKRVAYYFADVDSITKSRVTLDDNADDAKKTQLNVPASANVYVVDGRISNAKNRISLEDINYLEFDDELGKWTDGTNTADSYVMFAREVNGKVVDVVLYINYTIDK